MIRRTQVCSAVMVALGGTLGVAAVPAFGQQTLERVEITGSSIRRIAGETALPVTVIRVEDLAKQGVTNTEAAIAFIASNQSNFGSSQAIGATTGGKAEADLRGLSGPTGTNANKTLVLLNGRRLANHAFDAAAVDLNAIPLSAIQRIEVLRDGASAIYGTDAIGGVINFITKRELTGLEVSAQLAVPEKSGGGDTKRISLAGGFGTLSQNRFNLMASLDWRKQDVLPANQREFSKTGILGTTRGAILSGTSGTSFPGDLNGFEPTAPNCAPPASVPVQNAAGTGFGGCRYDFTQDIDILTQSEQVTGLLRASFAVAPDHIASFEYLNANNKSVARVAPAPTSSLIPATSPFFPAGALPVASQVIIPGFAGGNGTATTLGGVANWRQVPAGKRTSGDDTTTERMMLGMEGLFGDWDYRTAIGTNKNESEANVKGGYVNDSMIRQGIWNGVINPFGAQTAAGTAAIAAAQVNAPTIIGTNKSDFADLRVSNPSLFKLAAGSVGAAFGVEYRNERLNYEALPITGQLGSLGIDPNSDTSGKRNSKSAYAEFSIPVVKNVELTLAGRYDDYSSTGSTFNPKIGLRYQPTKALLVRASANTGFRAPTLFEIFQPQSLTFTSDSYDDPLLCPGGSPRPGASANVVCGQQVLQRQGGPIANGKSAESLQPEKSKAFTMGLVFEPSNNVTLGLDVWQIEIRNQISNIPEQAVFGAPTKYSAKFTRCSQLPATGAGITRANVTACTGFPGIGYDPIAFIDATTENLGELHTSGIDLSAAWRSGATPSGNFGVSMEGTYITKYEYQREQGGTFFNAVARYSDNAPVFRWQHVLSGTWSKGPWAATLTNRFKGSYSDQNDAGKVGAYSVFDLSGSWTGVKNLTVTAGVLNLLDKDPPRTVQNNTFQRGYDPRFTSPLGRTFTLYGSYKFF